MSSPDSMVNLEDFCPNCKAAVKVPQPRIAKSSTANTDRNRKLHATYKQRYGRLPQPDPRGSRRTETVRAKRPRARKGRAVAVESPPATDRQMNYARAIGLEFADDISKDEIGRMLTSYERIRHYLYGLWLFLAGESATTADGGKDYIQTYASAIINQDPSLAEEISELVGDDGHSEEFLPADTDLRDGIARDFKRKYETFTGRSFPA